MGVPFNTFTNIINNTVSSKPVLDVAKRYEYIVAEPLHSIRGYHPIRKGKCRSNVKEEGSRRTCDWFWLNRISSLHGMGRVKKLAYLSRLRFQEVLKKFTAFVHRGNVVKNQDRIFNVRFQ